MTSTVPLWLVRPVLAVLTVVKASVVLLTTVGPPLLST